MGGQFMKREERRPLLTPESRKPLLEDDVRDERDKKRLTTSDIEVMPEAETHIASDQSVELLPDHTLGELRARWQEVQASFVDEPRKAVRGANELVSHAIERLSYSFNSERRRLEEHWEQGTDASTEDLRIALKRYRAFFERLLAM